MNSTENFSAADIAPAVLVSVAEQQRQLYDLLKQLSPERLQVAADFVAYLAQVESALATQELLQIPGLLERVQQNQATPKADYAPWRTLCADV